MFSTVPDNNRAPTQPRPMPVDGNGRMKAPPSVGDMLLTVVLVLYPAFATVAVLVAGLLYSGAGA